ncbi:beta-chimaerin isoform X1 [Hydra vulgaris]|uniref:beta-chimaerin isoform X1 n=1 Tax=Hydra vulgaris TaxID=6087 RepID=UPI001F5FB35C|nr:beta-chimaerin isoform X1 [Hydra vulgaris]
MIEENDKSNGFSNISSFVRRSLRRGSTRNKQHSMLPPEKPLIPNANEKFQNEKPLNQVEPVWKSHLYQMQLKAPKPKRIVCNTILENRPSIYGKEFHGAISREEAEKLVMKDEGCYLTRESERLPGTYALTFRFNNAPKNYRLYYDTDEKMHFVGEKQFETIHDLVADGLITLYVDTYAKDYIDQMAANVTQNLIGNEPDRARDENDNEGVKKPSFKASEVAKEHNFKTQTYYGPHWCDYCKNFMWGLKSQGVRCQDCSYDCHQQCSKAVPNQCSPDKKLVKRVFGVDLTTLIKAHNLKRPQVIDSCIREIEERGMEVEGLYRIPGYADDITYLQNCIDKDGTLPDITQNGVKDVNVLCGLLKLYLRMLPIPIITFDLYDKFIEAIKQENAFEQIKSLSSAIKELPPAHYETLKYLCRHLQRLSKYKDKNLMSSENLGIVFGPTLMRPPDHLALMAVGNIYFQKRIIQLLIEEQDVLFDN